MGGVESIPHPLTPATADRLAGTRAIAELRPAVVMERFEAGKGTITLYPAFMLVTEKYAVAVVECDGKDGYRTIASGPADRKEEIWDDLEAWCDRNGFQDAYVPSDT